MPFYDLRCRECGREFNVMAKMSERESRAIKCPECGANELDAVFSSVNIIQSRKTAEAPLCPNVHKCGGCCGHGH